jgi:PEP-CTERM motif
MKYLIGAVTAALTVAQAHAATITTVTHSLLGQIHNGGGTWYPPQGGDPTPEPATWGLMIVGFALLAIAVRARRKVRA